MNTLTLGISPCPNDVFIFSGLLLNKVQISGVRFEVDYQDVERLNLCAQSGDLDVVKISYANYIHCRQEYELLSSGGALGRGVGPLLLVNEGTTEGRRKAKTDDSSLPLLVPGANTTANFLLDFYANPDGKQSLNKRFLPFDALYEELCGTPGARGVVIHEKRFTYEQDGLTLLQDLGEYWENRTGFAIPLGAICVRRSLGMTAMLNSMIQSCLDWAYTHYEEAFALCRLHAQDLSEGVIESHIQLYVNKYSQELGVEGEAAVRFFLAQQEKQLYKQA